MDLLPSNPVTEDSSEAAKILKSLKEDACLSEEESSADRKERVICDVLLPVLSKHPGLAEMVCETVAELAKIDNFRAVASEEGILISRLVPLLEEAPDIQLQAMRAIGNLCYNHDPCRQQFLDCGGCPMLANILNRCSEMSVAPLNVRFKAVACGCLLNICNNNDAVSTVMVKEKATQFLTSIVSKVDEDESVVVMAIRAMTALVDTDFDVGMLSCSGFASVLDSLLKRSNKGEIDVLEELMELISATVTQSEGSESAGAEWLSAFAQSGCIETLLDIRDPQHLQGAVDNIIRVLSYDVAMQSLFDGGRLLAWTKQTITDVSVENKLRASAALVLANMARNDSNCDVIIKGGFLSALTDILHLPTDQENCQLLYSVLSALRNLSLPETHKLTFLRDKVIDQVMVMVVNSSDSNVLFKAFGCLRLLSTKAEISQHIVQAETVMEKICQFCDDTGLPQIKTEGGRLLASLIKNSNSQDSVAKVVERGGTKMLLFLLGTDHAITQNEGLIALSIAAALRNSTFAEVLVEVDFAGKLASLMTSCNSVKMLHNCLVLMETLIASSTNGDAVRQILTSEKLSEVLNSLSSHEDSATREKSSQLSLVCTQK